MRPNIHKGHDVSSGENSLRTHNCNRPRGMMAILVLLLYYFSRIYDGEVMANCGNISVTSLNP